MINDPPLKSLYQNFIAYTMSTQSVMIIFTTLNKCFNELSVARQKVFYTQSTLESVFSDVKAIFYETGFEIEVLIANHVSVLEFQVAFF